VQRRMEEGESLWGGRLESVKQQHKEEAEALALRVDKAEATARDHEAALGQMQVRWKKSELGFWLSR
jgi:hypothetical protein